MQVCQRQEPRQLVASPPAAHTPRAATLLLRQQYLWLSGHVAAHLAGSLAMTVLGIALTRSLLRH